MFSLLEIIQFLSLPLVYNHKPGLVLPHTMSSLSVVQLSHTIILLELRRLLATYHSPNATLQGLLQEQLVNVALSTISLHLQTFFLQWQNV